MSYINKEAAIDLIESMIADKGVAFNPHKLAMALKDMESVEIPEAKDADLISRQAAIEALTGWQTDPTDEEIVRTLKALQPVMHDQRTETHACDCISRQAVIDLILDAQDGSGQTYEAIRDLLHEVAYMPPVEPKPVMTEEVREALMRLTMCAREECSICKYENDCGYDKQVKMATENMNTILNVFLERPKTTETMMVDGEPTEIDPLSYEVGYSHGQPERPKGRWIDIDLKPAPNGVPFEKCENCREWSAQLNKNFCPNCGADMRGDKE